MITVIVSIIALAVSAFSLFVSYKAHKVALAQVELDIRNLITRAKERYEDKVLSFEENKTKPVYTKLMAAVLEDYLNAFDEACAKYVDNKIDKKRFKKTYFDEIRQLVESNAFRDKYAEPQTKYEATIKVYREWNKRE